MLFSVQNVTVEFDHNLLQLSQHTYKVLMNYFTDKVKVNQTVWKLLTRLPVPRLVFSLHFFL